MEAKISLDATYKPSEDIVTREIQEEFIIVPITSGAGDLEDVLFTLNETGKAMWDRLNGKRSLKDVANALALEFEASGSEIEKDVLGLVEELLRRKMLVEVKMITKDF